MQFFSASTCSVFNLPFGVCGCRGSRVCTDLSNSVEGTWTFLDFGICGVSWNKSPTDIKWQLSCWKVRSYKWIFKHVREGVGWGGAGAPAPSLFKCQMYKCMYNFVCNRKVHVSIVFLLQFQKLHSTLNSIYGSHRSLQNSSQSFFNLFS